MTERCLKVELQDRCRRREGVQSAGVLPSSEQKILIRSKAKIGAKGQLRDCHQGVDMRHDNEEAQECKCSKLGVFRIMSGEFNPRKLFFGSAPALQIIK